MTSGWDFRGIDPGENLPDIDTTVAHSARIYDYILGGKDNFAADRQAAARALAANPNLASGMRENRALMRRMTAFLAAEAGVRQFLDIGTGLPTSPNMHEIAQSFRPDSRILYVDNDPIVLTHARALLTSNAEGSTAYIHADLRQPEKILADPRLVETLDLSEPVALMMFGVLHFIPDEDDPYGIVTRLLTALPSGSYLAAQHPTRDFYADGVGAQGSYRNAGIPFQYRSRADFERFLTGLELVPPGLVPMVEWRAENEPEPRPSAAKAGAYAALGRKP
ncbi:MAG TPA: SAM-dependent methyltransferase [Streptosporangiaceae bacterium]